MLKQSGYYRANIRAIHGFEATNTPKNRYAPLTSIDIQRSFSALQVVLREKGMQ